MNKMLDGKLTEGFESIRNAADSGAAGSADGNKVTGGTQGSGSADGNEGTDGSGNADETDGADGTGDGSNADSPEGAWDGKED